MADEKITSREANYSEWYQDIVKRAELAEDGLSEAEIAARTSADEARLQNQMRLQRPFLSANDRSRWLTVRSLVEHGTYEIDAIVSQPTWDSIDKVRERLKLRQAAREKRLAKA